MERLRDRAWYLHREGEQFYFKETENLGRRIERDARQVPAPKLEQALINRLTGLFKAQSKSRAAYQEVQIMPRLDDVKLSGSRILLVVQPDGRTPPEAIRNFYEFQQEKNNVLILSDNDSHLAVDFEARLREPYAIEKIQANLKPGDSLYDEARDKLEELEERFTKAVSGAYNRLFYPGPSGGGEGELVMATIDNGLSFGDGEYAAETQLEKGPFPAEKASVNVIALGTSRETGETRLSLTPRNAGDSPRVYVLKTNSVSEQYEQVQDLEDYRTTEATLYFVAVDSSGKYQTGEPTRWTADLTIRHELHKLGDGGKLELHCKMIALDTNILARFYVDDPGDPEAALQRPIAHRILTESPSLFVPTTVVLEPEWVLRAFYRFDVRQIVGVFEHLLGLRHVNTKEVERIAAALRLTDAGMDFSDALHLTGSSHCEALYTFDDRRFARRARRLTDATQVLVPTAQTEDP